MYDDGVMFGRAVAEHRNALQWKVYAKDLERQLRISQANTAGLQAVRDKLVKELAQLDPGHYL